MKRSNSWGAAPFQVRNATGPARLLSVSGRDRWALECLMAAGTNGCTPIETPGPRWSGYVHNLREIGIAIETIHEKHGGPFPGTHARYVLRSHVTRASGKEVV